MSNRPRSPSQLMALFLHVADALGFRTDREVADIADVSPENVSNWRRGLVREFKPQKLEAVKASLAGRIDALAGQAGERSAPGSGTCAIEIADGASPADLQRQLRDRVHYDYLGHRFLYFESQGALAWESILKAGYGQQSWLDGVAGCADTWLDTTLDGAGRPKGPLAVALGLRRKSRPRGLDLVSLGPGDGAKERILLERLVAADRASSRRLSWLCYAPIDVSIPLLVAAARAGRRTIDAARTHQVRPVCADFEEGSLGFLEQLPSARRPAGDGLRLVVMLGNIFGNLRSEEAFLRHKLGAITRPGDMLWVEVGIRLDPLERDPLFRMTQTEREPSAAEAHRRLLLEGPYRRWEAAIGRPPAPLDIRVWVREDDDASRVPGSVNFCHDLVFTEQRRVCTMLYSRRYDIDELSGWLGRRGWELLAARRVTDTKRQPRVAHLLLRRAS